MGTKKNKTGAASNQTPPQTNTPPAEQGAGQAGQQAPEQKLLGDPAQSIDQTGGEQQNPNKATLTDTNTNGDGQADGQVGNQAGSVDQAPVPGSKEETKKVDPPAPPTPKSKFVERCEEVAKKYAPHYPASKAFHFCSDMQVFLEGDKAEADAHQTAIDPKRKVTTVNV